jgi:hypothetical protein
VVATGPYTSCLTNSSAMAEWAFKQQCCFTVNVCLTANSDVIFWLSMLRFRNHIGVRTCILFMWTKLDMIQHVYFVLSSLLEASIPRYVAMFRLVLGCLISNIKHGYGFRASEIRNLIVYSCVYSFLSDWYWKKCIDNRVRKKSSAGRKTQENGFPARHIFANIVLDKQLNFNCDSKLLF